MLVSPSANNQDLGKSVAPSSSSDVLLVYLGSQKLYKDAKEAVFKQESAELPSSSQSLGTMEE